MNILSRARCFLKKIPEEILLKIYLGQYPDLDFLKFGSGSGQQSSGSATLAKTYTILL
jgi:hypothetical protein